MTRRRVQLARSIPGTYDVYNGVTNTFHAVSDYEVFRNTCDDELGFPTPHPLTIEHREWLDMQRLNGTDIQGTFSYVADKHIPQRYSGESYGSILHGSPPGRPISPATSLYARSNPSRPVVDLPVFIAELRELPELVKFAAEKGIVRKVAGGNLSYQFGIRPLVSDLKSLLDFNGHFDKRSQEIHRLYEKNGLRRRIKLWSGSINSTSPSDVISGAHGSKLITAKVFKQTKVEIWGTIRWRPTSLPPTTERKYAELARRAVLGLTIDFNTAWQLLPWSWLVDWFSSSGDYLIANRNLVPAKAQDACVMTRSETVWAFTRNTDNMNWSGGNAIARLTTKQRQVNVVPTLVADLPFLHARRLSILGSLAVLRTGGYGLKHRT